MKGPNKKKRPNVLMISDIHMFESYTNNLDCSKFINQLVADLKSYIKEVTHLLICGDLVFSGKKKEFEKFHELFVSPLLDEETGNPDLIVLPVFGNHDINRDNFDYNDISKLKGNRLQEKINSLIDRIKENLFQEVSSMEKIKLKEGDSGKDLDEILKLSFPYRSYFKREISKTLNKKHLKSIGYVESEGLVGILIDEKHDIVFNILNSSWFALGDRTLFNLFQKKLTDNTLNQFIKELEKNNLREQGQLSYLTLKVTESDLRSIANLDNYLVITSSHHPYHHCRDGYGREMKNILNNTDFLITGHIHNEPVPVSILRNHCFHVELPQLFDYKYNSIKDNVFELKFQKNNAHGFVLLRFFDAENIELETSIYNQKVKEVEGNIELEYLKDTKVNLKSLKHVKSKWDR